MSNFLESNRQWPVGRQWAEETLALSLGASSFVRTLIRLLGAAKGGDSRPTKSGFPPKFRLVRPPTLDSPLNTQQVIERPKNTAFLLHSTSSSIHDDLTNPHSRNSFRSSVGRYKIRLTQHAFTDVNRSFDSRRNDLHVNCTRNPCIEEREFFKSPNNEEIICSPRNTHHKGQTKIAANGRLVKSPAPIFFEFRPLGLSFICTNWRLPRLTTPHDLFWSSPIAKFHKRNSIRTSEKQFLLIEQTNTRV